jgi:hypothetical protein
MPRPDRSDYLDEVGIGELLNGELDLIPSDG